MIKVLVVDDSSFTRKLLREMLILDPEIEVIGEAADGQEAVEQVHKLSPDVVTMDIIMPVSDGIWALEEVMKQKPTPVIMVSSISQLGSDIVEIAYSLGVIDVVLKPKNPQSIGLVSDELIQKIKAVARIDRERLLSYSSLIKSPNLIRGLRLRAATVVAIGSSAGGLVSLTEVLTMLPGDFSAGIVIGQHIPHQFLIHFVDRIRTLLPFYIRIAQKGDIVFQKSILFSPGDSSISAVRTKKGIVANLVTTERKLQPDIDEIFSSCADAFGKNVVCVVLSGMGRDGTKGAADIKKAGGIIIAEDKSTAGIFGMPRSVIESNLADYILPSTCISDVLVELVSGRQPMIMPAEIMLVRGTVLKTCIDYVTDKLGEPRVKAVISSCNERIVRGIRPLLPDRFYSGEFFREICSKTMEIYPGGDKRREFFFEEMGKRIAQNNILAYRDTFFARGVQINDCPTAVPGILFKEFRGIRARVNSFNVVNHSMVLVIGGPAVSRSDVVSIIVPLITGWMKEFFCRCAANNMTISSKMYNDAQEKPCVEFSLQWA
jgi:two-component system chemotaxis response regulator CheB